MWVGLMVFINTILKCFALCYVMHLSTFVSDDWSKCALIYFWIRNSILYWFCCGVDSRIGISSCVLSFWVQTGISLEMFLTLYWFLAKKYLLSKWLSLSTVLCCSFMTDQAHLQTAHMHHKVPQHHQSVNLCLLICQKTRARISYADISK